MKSDNSNPAATTAQHNSTSPVIWALLAIVIGIILPPVGLILAAFALYRAGQKSSRPAMVFGVLALITVAASSALYWRYYERNRSDLNNKSYGYSQYEKYTVPGDSKGVGMSFNRLGNFVDFPYIYQTYNQRSLGQIEKIPGLKNGAQVASISALTTNLPLHTSAKTYSELFSNIDQSSIAYKAFTNSLLQFLFITAYPNSHITFTKPEAFTNPSIKHNAWALGYISTTKFLDGSTSQFYGDVVFAVSKQRQYFFALDTLKKNWYANKSTWENVFNSLKIDQ